MPEAFGSMSNLQNGLTVSLQNLAERTQKSGLVCSLPPEDQFEEDIPPQNLLNSKKDTIVKVTDF